MGLKDIGAKLPPGFRFHPSDEELVCHYLRNKIRAKFNHHHDGGGDDDDGHEDDAEANMKNNDLVEIDLHTCEPWQLPDVAKLNVKEWYFFSFRDRKYAVGYRTNRATVSGYWKATGKDRMVVDPRTRQIVGMRKTLVFYRNRAPNGIKTTWIMHEFRLECPNTPPMEDWVLCRVFNKCKESQLQEEESRFVISDNNLNYAPNYTHLPRPSPPSNDMDYHHHHQIPCGWGQMMGHHRPSSSPTSSNIHHTHHHDQSMEIPCGWDQMMETLSSSSGHCPQAHESLLNMFYHSGVINVASTERCDNEDNYKGMFSDMGLEKACIGSSSSDILLENDGLGFEIDNTTADFQ
ncbi:PREDICTED: NAC domain-containing protein 21/22-like [Tarenaya hassleriana]|uniref:NAC domain-containing protein 21/22-like n=1 Tax=Tarenaya hassleriana TaxID=28532 RepID=UPI00053C83E4|nr:PREDICTED: NAC domain-containing protein 21/22-like [Tarenaya hassleriana]